MALKKNSVHQGVLMGVSGWKRLPWRLTEKIADEPTWEHRGIQYIGQVHQIEIKMLGLVLKFLVS
jgi:hypothetical protein